LPGSTLATHSAQAVADHPIISSTAQQLNTTAKKLAKDTQSTSVTTIQSVQRFLNVKRDG
jgi:hypothetical protein